MTRILALLVGSSLRLSYADAEQVAAMIRRTSTKRGSVMVDTCTNTILVTDVNCD
jgi:hypothetical protein